MRAHLTALTFGLALAAFGCFTASSDLQAANGAAGGVAGGGNGHHTAGNGGSSKASSVGTSGGGTSGGGSSSGGASSASSSTSGGNGSTGAATSAACVAPGSDTGGGTVIFDCDNVPYYDGSAGGCPADWLGSQVLDFETCTAICGASVQATSPEGVPVGGTAQYSDPNTGQFHFCLPVGTTFETTVTAPGYGNFYYGEIQGQLAVPMPLFGLLNNDELTAFGMFVNPPIDFQKGNLVSFIFNIGTCNGGSGPTSETGWTVFLTDEFGNPYPDGGYNALYVDNNGLPDYSLTATEGLGVVIIYNIDPSVAQFPTIHATNPNAGGCTVVNANLNFTGRVQVGPGIFTEQGIFIE